MKKYVFEKEIVLPLCGIEEDVFFKYFTGEIITDDEFIRNGLKKKTLYIKEVELNIYVIFKYIMPTYDREFMGYIVEINGCSNFLNINKQPLNDIERNAVVKGLSSGKYNKELVWGDNCE